MRQVTPWTYLARTPFSWFYLKEFAKLLVRTMRYPYCTWRWINFLNSNPLLRQLTWISPRLVTKIYHPYFNKKMNRRAKLSMLAAHYQFMLQLGFGALLLRAARSPVPLGEIRGKYGDYFSLQLSAVAPMEREGDLLLQIVFDERALYSIAFHFLKSGPAMAVGIGCIQGPAGGDGLARVRHATHALHGLRPKNLLVRLIQQLGFELGCRDMFLVGNQNRAADYAIRKRQVHADYDALWQEMGAARLPTGNFHMACAALPPLDIQSIPSKKRSEAKKRHQTLLEISNLFISNINFERNFLSACPPRGSSTRTSP